MVSLLRGRVGHLFKNQIMSKYLIKASLEETKDMLGKWALQLRKYALNKNAKQGYIDVQKSKAETVQRLVEIVEQHLTKNTFVDGKILPQAVELESAILGALMLDYEAMDKVSFLAPLDFYRNENQIIFQSILQLVRNGIPVDMLTVVEQLRADGQLKNIGGPFAITELTNKIASAQNIEYHARILQQFSIRRKAIKLCDEVMKRMYDPSCDVFKNLDYLKNNFFDLEPKKVVNV